MKNVLSIDSTNACRCDLVSSVNDGTNRVVLEIRADVSKNPLLQISGQSAVTITSEEFIYEIPASLLSAGSTLTFNIKDSSHTGDTFSITMLPGSGSWILKQTDNFNYILSPVFGSDGTVPEWKLLKSISGNTTYSFPVSIWDKINEFMLAWRLGTASPWKWVTIPRDASKEIDSYWYSENYYSCFAWLFILSGNNRVFAPQSDWIKGKYGSTELSASDLEVFIYYR